MIQKISFGETAKTNNVKKVDKKTSTPENTSSSTSVVKLLGLAALAATAIGGIYYMSRGKSSSSVQKHTNEFAEQLNENLGQKMEMNDEAKKIYSEISERCNAKISVDVNDKKSKPLEDLAAQYKEEEAIAAEKYFTGVKKHVDKETLSTISETFENGKLVKKSVNYNDVELGKVDEVTTFNPQTGKIVSKEIVGNIVDRDGKVLKSNVVFKREIFDEGGKFIQKYEQDNGMFEIWKQIEDYNPKTGKIESDYFCNMGSLHVRNFEADGDTIKSSISISRIKTENFDEAVKLYKRYASLSDDEIKTLYIQKLQNSEGMSNLEFKILQGNYDLRFDTEPFVSRAETIVPEHGAVHGYNHRIRDFVEGGMKDESELKCLKSQIEKLDADFANLTPLEKDCVFYRGLASSYIPQVINGKVGDIVVPDKGYAYGAFHRVLADSFNGGTILVIHTPKGAKISRCSAHGGEVLYPRGAEYKILSKNKDPEGTNVIELEYILPKI